MAIPATNIELHCRVIGGLLWLASAVAVGCTLCVSSLSHILPFVSVSTFPSKLCLLALRFPCFTLCTCVVVSLGGVRSPVTLTETRKDSCVGSVCVLVCL